tara:strand:+ start:4296 stop:4625 length:330 start_codon:yes stop_codon:yes gene_type:complete
MVVKTKYCSRINNKIDKKKTKKQLIREIKKYRNNHEKLTHITMDQSDEYLNTLDKKGLINILKYYYSDDCRVSMFHYKRKNKSKPLTKKLDYAFNRFLNIFRSKSRKRY